MARSFFIVRASEDPTALEFFPPKGSDELHEALKQAFPFESNLASRMRAATIEFLLQEQQADLTPVSTESPYLPSPQSSFLSTMPSPAMTMTGPSMPVQTTSPAARRSSATAQPPQEALMDVWSLPNKPQAKVHTRRTMTAEEKKAYKQKRIIGACADCKKRRRKCEHNAAGGSNISPQKVGKHKKRTSTAPASVSKPEAASDLSWSAPPPFNFDVAFDASAMPLNAEMSFDFAATDFSFSPDLSDDWQLFPDVPVANNANFIDSWPSNYYDESQYTPNASMVQQRVSPSSGTAGFLNGNSAILDTGDTAGGIFSTDPFGSGVFGNLTPASLSPMSRTQSASGQQAVGQANYSIPSTTNSPASSSSYSPGAHMKQSHVSRDKPIQVPLASPDPSPSPAYSDTLLHSFVNDHNIDHNNDCIDPSRRIDSDSSCRTSHGFANDHTSTWLHKSCSGDGASEDAKHDGPAQYLDRGRLRNALPVREENDRMTSIVEDREQSHAEASLLIRELLQSKGSLRNGASCSTTTSTTTVTTSTPSTMSRLRSRSSDAQLASKLQTKSDRVATAGNRNTEGSARDLRQELAQCYYATTTGPKLLQTSRSVWQAPLCVAAYVLYQMMAHSGTAWAMFATVLLGTLVLSLQLSSQNGTGSSKSALASLRNWLRLSSSLDRKTITLSGRNSRSPRGWTKSLASHLGQRVASVMV